ncbi:MAG: PAS domain S-box protein [Chitinophagaceae bacterium]
MSKPNAIRSITTDHLSVIHRATDARPLTGQHAVVQANLLFNITGWNAVAEELFGRPGTPGINFFNFVNIDFPQGNSAELLSALHHTGYWSGDVWYQQANGQKISLGLTASHIYDTADKPDGIMIVASIRNSGPSLKDEQLAAAEIKFDALVNTLQDGVVIIGADGKIVTTNKKAASILGLPEEEMIGKVVGDFSWKAIRPDGSVFPPHQFPGVVSLQTGFPQRNVIMGVEQDSGERVWLSVNSEALIKPGQFDPYAVVVSYTDITNFITAQNELIKSNERFRLITLVSSDAVWDFDLVKNEIYRSETFGRISGYGPDEINSNLNWWFEKVHPDDRDRVKHKLEEHLRKKSERWEDEYRFEYADGSYKTLHDSGIILYKDRKPLRILGAIRDVTNEKILKQQLADEQAQKQKAITLATLQAQEQEKIKISRELHDNVNQIIMSAKLYMETAVLSSEKEKADSLLEKAVEYQLLALHEIRKLSRSLNSPAITSSGLQESIRDITDNLEALQQIKVKFTFDSKLEKRLNNDEKLTIYRVVQEQSNNIIKYAAATEVKIRVTESGGQLHLYISDNGKGFDTTVTEGRKGIGLLNMTSRATAHGGTLAVISSPGNGCILEMKFPIA